MKKFFYLILCITLYANLSCAQTAGIRSYSKKSYMIPTRDGIKLHTVVLTPVGATEAVPFLIQRTPYGASFADLKDESTVNTEWIPALERAMAKEGYILVFQDIRGKFKSEGQFEMNRPLYHLRDKTKIDESTDTWDSIDWLLKNIPNNNGKAGILGVSYLGFTALQATADPHPALKASAPQASPADMFLGDDFHHNGAFRLSYGFEYSYLVENAKGNSDYPFPQFDLFNWYLQLGPLSTVNESLYKNRIPTWNEFVAHPNYDDFWKRQSSLNNIPAPKIPILHVGGYYDQEDLNGPQAMYSVMEKMDGQQHRNYLVLGPWNHGQWSRNKADSLGAISFEGNTAEWYQQLQKKWFDYWLKDKGDGKFDEAYCFQTGSNTWKSYPNWPPAGTTVKKLYLQPDLHCSFETPSTDKGVVSYDSDPAKPVPYRDRPIEATYGDHSRWGAWQVEDQRFVSSRPDVVNFILSDLPENFTITGNIKCHLFASTTASDADFVVKLIDVYPDFDSRNMIMSGYELPVTMEVFRGRFRKGFDKPIPFTPGKPEEIVIDLHQVNHRFLKGHKLMVQIQSSWFPLIDRNPQKFVPNIFQAKAADFVKARHSIYCNKQFASYLELPVLRE